MFSFFQRKPKTPGPALDAGRKLLIPEQIYRRMLNHCLEERPLEACGLLVGEGGQVIGGYATDNAHRSPIVYKVDDRQLLEVFNAVRSEKQEIICIYHSHVETEPIPSRTDIEQANWPEAFYLIVSLAQNRPRVRAWRIVDKQVTEHPVEIQKQVPGSWHDLRVAVRNRGGTSGGP